MRTTIPLRLRRATVVVTLAVASIAASSSSALAEPSLPTLVIHDSLQGWPESKSVNLPHGAVTPEDAQKIFGTKSDALMKVLSDAEMFGRSWQSKSDVAVVLAMRFRSSATAAGFVEGFARGAANNHSLDMFAVGLDQATGFRLGSKRSPTLSGARIMFARGTVAFYFECWRGDGLPPDPCTLEMAGAQEQSLPQAMQAAVVRPPPVKSLVELPGPVTSNSTVAMAAGLLLAVVMTLLAAAMARREKPVLDLETPDATAGTAWPTTAYNPARVGSRFANVSARSNILRWLLICSAVVSAWELAAHFLTLGMILRGQHVGLDVVALRNQAARLRTAGDLWLLSFGATATMWLYWQHGAQKNVRLQPRGATLSPARSVWSWFIPVMNIALAYQAMHELSATSEPAASPTDWKRMRPRKTLIIWYATWLGAGAVSIATGALARQRAAMHGPASVLSLMTAGSIVTILLRIAAAAFAIVLVTRVRNSQNNLSSDSAGVAAVPSLDVRF